MTKMVKGKKKAISPIIATLILIVIAVVAGVMLYGFVTGFMAKTTTATGAISTLAIDSAGISVSATTYQANISVTNTGNMPVTVTTVNLLNATTGALMYTYPESKPVTIPAGQTVVIPAFNKGSIPKSMVGKTTLIQVVTSTGSYAETSAVIGP
jgi:flagellin-like protein